MKTNLQFSIIIPHLRGKEILKKCLDSIKSQTYKHYDVAIIDNGTNLQVERFVQLFPPNFRYIRAKKNLGFSKAVNIGIDNTKGELILVLNDDTELPSDTLKKCSRLCHKYKSYGSYAIKILSFNTPTEIDSAGLMFSIRGYGNRSNRNIVGKNDQSIEVFGPCGAGAIYWRKALEVAGKFNEDFFFFYEDLELAFRLQLNGFKSLYLPSITIFHHRSLTMDKYFDQKVYQAIRNSILTLISSMPFELLKEYKIEIIKFYLKLLKIIAKKGYLLTVVKALLAVLYKLPQYLIKRNSLNKLCSLNMADFKNLLYSGPIEINFPNETLLIS